MQEFEISSVADLIEAKDFMIRNQNDIKITNISELEYKIKLSGGRYDNYNFEYIDADVARIILEYQEQYNNFVTALEKRFNIQIPQSQKVLKFKLEKGCLEISTDLKDIIKEGFKHMNGWHIMVVFIIAIGGWYARDSYHKYIELEQSKVKLEQSKIELEQSKIASEQEVKDKEIEKEKLSIVLSNINDLVSGRELQEPANRAKKAIAATLQEGERAIINPDIKEQANKPITVEDKDKFRVVLPQEEELPSTEEEIDDIFHIEAQHFTPNKIFRIKELKLNVSSTPISATKRMEIIRKADRQEPVRLKIKLIKNAKTGGIEEALILDVIN
ncbi:hypothetical protein CCAL6883_08300 [Campylobacter sp. RM6883]|uniref:hypothetical protein n=1 Tax=Campylobacter californiensis TaxID=1032243 RepID=UPI0014525251|nr:hypothetical protein [Campylobacter sp. RM6914]MBE2985336.1 hypothetical protein [Campylobacter sp. RM6883]MBE2995869.1 hypothetical protein [Campylobacter sp. RM6913]QCD51241.1 hypothetical protein CCAL_1356 [Campylobacter sp. RM6914]